MLGVATVALFLAGVIAALVGQSIVGQQTRTEMARQAQAIEALLGERLAEDVDSSRLLSAVLHDERDVPSAIDGTAGRARGLFQLLASARRLFGSPLVDIAFVNVDGSVEFLTESTGSALAERLSAQSVLDGQDQFVQIPSSEVAGNVPFLVHARPIPVAGLENAPVRMAIVVAR